MATRAPARVRFEAVPGWRIETAPAWTAPRRGGDPFPHLFLQPGRVEVAVAYRGTPSPRRGGAPAAAEVTVEARPKEAYIFAIRHASGAITFHAPHFAVETRRAGSPPGATLAFSLPLAPAAVSPGLARQRALVSGIVKIFLLRVLGGLIDRSLPKLSARWEKARWKSSGVPLGLVRVTAEGLRSGRLEPADLSDVPASARSLLFVHGFLSDAAAAFADLAAGFLADVAPIYGDRVFAFNHFTVSKMPEESARELLDVLPGRPLLFDAVTHSRGGLVLRTAIERPDLFGETARNFRLSRAVLVGAPNEGTPLASQARWETAVGWIANLLDLFPKGPLSLGISFVTEAIVWLAHRAAGAIPGIASLAPESDTVRELNAPPAPPPGALSAVAANYEPDQALLLRMADAGVDAFFQTANDLVVPTEGGWRIDRGTAAIPPERIGCFGPGGNLAASSGEAVHHLNFFGQKETADFLVQALLGRPHALTRLDPARDLPYRGRAPLPEGVQPAAMPPSGSPAPALAPRSPEAAGPIPSRPRGTLEVLLLSAGGPASPAQLLAFYDGARVVEKFPTHGGEAGERMRGIIAMHERILGVLSGRAASRDLPKGKELLAYGTLLFETLFPGEVGRLYDVARSREAGRLDLVFTSSIDWIADKPWEFAFDPSRHAFLAAEDVNFVRNVVTAVPAEVVPACGGPLRVLVVAAQPVGTVPLSIAEEEDVIRRGFTPLVEAGVVTIDAARTATPDLLHERLVAGRYDVLHFIGHGEYDEEEKVGTLVFEDGRGGTRRVDSRTLRQILGGRGLALVFLNACETGRGGRADFNRGVAPSLVAGGVPAVVANQYSVLDSSATAFAQHFYWEIAQGKALGDAAREARVAVNYSIAGEAIDWAVPVLYARNPRAVLCAPLATPARRAPPRALSRLPEPEAAAPQHVRVALWDVNGTLPSLERVAETMNAAQERFAFEIAAISAPLGTWRLRKTESGAPGVVEGAEMAERLRPKPGELGADHLICLTGFRVPDEGKGVTLWNEDPEGKIAIVSTAGPLAAVRSRGLPRERALANTVVAVLVQARADIAPHRRAPRTCPLHLAFEKSAGAVAAPMAFDAVCRRRLKAVAADDLVAAEKILRAFRDAG